VLYRAFEGRLSIDQLEGDAICATTERTDVEILAWIKDTFGGYHRRLRDIKAATSCPCKACATVGDLGLKFFVHAGTFNRQQIGSRVQLFGTDVNLVHRLTKNDVPLREYVYASAPALAGWPDDAKAGFVDAPQTYDLGAIQGAYLDLAAEKTIALHEPMTRATPETARWKARTMLEAPIAVVWRLWTEPALLRRRFLAERFDYLPGARGTYVGGEFHCHHGNGETSVMRVIESEPPREMTVVMTMPGIPSACMTDRLEADGPERTVWECFWGWPDPDQPEATEGTMQYLDQMGPVLGGNVVSILAELTGRPAPQQPA